MFKRILGNHVDYQFNDPKSQLNKNEVVIGGSGSGKTWGLVEPFLLYADDISILVSIAKRRIFKLYVSLFRKKNYKIIDFNIRAPEKGDGMYDPMSSVHSLDDVENLSKEIVESYNQDNTNRDKYWDIAAETLLKAIIGYVYLTKKNCTMADVMDLFHAIKIQDGRIPSYVYKMFDLSIALDPTNFVMKSFQSFYYLPEKTMSCVYSTLDTGLTSMFPHAITEAIRHNPNIDIEQIAREKTILFVTTQPGDKASELYVNLFYRHFIKRLFLLAENEEDEVLPIPVHMIFDDFAVTAKIEDFEKQISIFREKNISCTLLLQSLTQLEDMYNTHSATTIVNNCDTYIYLGGMDVNTCRDISVRVNCPLEDIMRMKVGKMVVIRRGEVPFFTERYNILQDKQYQQLIEDYTQR